jgi:hypothetical protein
MTFSLPIGQLDLSKEALLCQIQGYHDIVGKMAIPSGGAIR